MVTRQWQNLNIAPWATITQLLPALPLARGYFAFFFCLITLHQILTIDLTKHLITGPFRNSLFCLNLNVSLNIEIGETNLFPLGPEIKCILLFFFALFDKRT